MTKRKKPPKVEIRGELLSSWLERRVAFVREGTVLRGSYVVACSKCSAITNGVETVSTAESTAAQAGVHLCEEESARFFLVV